MTTLTIDLPPEVYAWLRAEAERQGKRPEGIARELLTERYVPPADRERSIAAMRAAGLLVEPSPAMIARASRATMTLEEVSAALDQAGGKPLSEIILEQRGPKE
jgi:hypothetical protein